jgi:hypothetical protein
MLSIEITKHKTIIQKHTSLILVLPRRQHHVWIMMVVHTHVWIPQNHLWHLSPHSRHRGHEIMATLPTSMLGQHMGPPHQTWLSSPHRLDQDPPAQQRQPLKKLGHQNGVECEVIRVDSPTPIHISHNLGVQKHTPCK